MTGEKHPAYGKRGPLCPNFGKTPSAERRAITSKGLTGKKQDPLVVAKRAASNTGKKYRTRAIREAEDANKV